MNELQQRMKWLMFAKPLKTIITKIAIALIINENLKIFFMFKKLVVLINLFIWKIQWLVPSSSPTRKKTEIVINMAKPKQIKKYPPTIKSIHELHIEKIKPTMQQGKCLQNILKIP